MKASHIRGGIAGPVGGQDQVGDVHAGSGLQIGVRRQRGVASDGRAAGRRPAEDIAAPAALGKAGYGRPVRFRTCKLGSSCAAASAVAPIWDVTVFTKNRDRLLGAEVASKFFAAALADPEVKPLLSSEYFSVAGTLIEAWASMKSFRPKESSGAPPGPGRNGQRDFHAEERSDETHASTTVPDARLARKSNGQASKLCVSAATRPVFRRGG